jgi:hypothetical protein
MQKRPAATDSSKPDESFGMFDPDACVRLFEQHAAAALPFSQWGSCEGTLRLIRSLSPGSSHRDAGNVATFSDRRDVAIHPATRDHLI